MLLHIITQCTRPHNLLKIRDSIFANPSSASAIWHIIFDSGVLKDLDAELLSTLSLDHRINIHYSNSSLIPNVDVVNDIIEKISFQYDDSWIYFLNDTSTLTSEFFSTVYELENDPVCRVIAQDLCRDGKFLDSHYIIHIDLFYALNEDGTFKAFSNEDRQSLPLELYKKYPEDFRFTSQRLCNYNQLKKVSSARVPKVLYIGPGKPEIKSSSQFSSHTQDLDVKHIKNDIYAKDYLKVFDPDVIVTVGDSWDNFAILKNLDLDIRKRWLHFTFSDLKHVDIGQAAYDGAMQYILSQDTSKLISYFTSMYNTGDKLWKTYESLANQTYPNWEWVLVNDSTDGGKTLKIAEQIAERDHRVKVYDFREKSGGNIGDVKYKAAVLTRGNILAELDHDDIVTPQLSEWLYKASVDHPECGFFYTDCSTPTPNWENRWFQGSFSFDYGSYRDEEYDGHMLKVTNQHNINPVTIRHIVGIPNHVRAWRRDTYMKIGGHRRRLSIADDYELVVRTFLETRMCHIPKLGYIQFMYEGDERNTHDIVRADIQRRVKSIAIYYHQKIKDRFDELGLHDWAYERNPKDPTASWYSPWPKGDEEQSATITWRG